MTPQRKEELALECRTIMHETFYLLTLLPEMDREEKLELERRMDGRTARIKAYSKNASL